MEKKKDVLIEIGCEDLPSWTGNYLKERWFPAVVSLFEENRIGCGQVHFFHTGRRLILFVREVAEKQQDVTMEVYGPPVEMCVDKNGNYTPAAEKFAASHGIKAENLLVREKKGKKVLVAVREEKGQPVTGILGKMIAESLRKTEIPRAMRWNAEGFRFIRPVRWILALYGDKVIEMETGGIKSGRYSYGHRVMSPGKFTVADPQDYLDKALKKFVIYDPEVRFEFTKAAVRKKLSATLSSPPHPDLLPPGEKEKERNGRGKNNGESLKFDEEYVRYISALVEYPCVEACSLKDEHMNLPDEVVGAVIKKLNGVPLLEQNGKLHFRYAAVFDGVGGEEIRKNYESVLHAKMEDASFFMEKDMQYGFASYTEQLKNIMYNPRWGSVHDRVERFKKIYGILRDYFDLNAEQKENASLIVSLCKNDLPTLMVAEFPSLEGVIGRIYAERNGYNAVVSSGIEQHYLPRYSGDSLPDTKEARIVSMAVRLETICGLMIEDVKVKGAGDPYGLKKLANGFIEMVWDEKAEFPLRDVINKTADVFDPDVSPEVTDKIFNFILQRAENLLAGEGTTPGIRRAVVSAHRENLVMMREKIDALEKFFKSGAGAKSLLVPFIRVANILRQAEEKGITPGEFDESLLADKTEKELYEFYRSEESIKELCAGKKYDEFLLHLSGWKKIVDRYFDDVLIMSPDEKLRDNRLALMRKINALFNLFADFSLIPLAEVENA